MLERKELIQKFEKYFATNPNPNITAAQCASIAEDYADSKIEKLNEAIVSEVRKCEKCDNNKARYCHTCYEHALEEYP